MRKKLHLVGSGDDSPMVQTPSESLRVAQGLVPQAPYSLINYSVAPPSRPDFESQVRSVGDAVARIDQVRAAGGAAESIEAFRAQQQARLLEGTAAALERATHGTARDPTEELARAESTLQRLNIEEGEGHAMLVQRGEDLEAREAALQADILKAEAARAQHEHTRKALAEERAAEGRAIYEATEARATMDKAAAEGRAMDESAANARGLLQLAQRDTALRAETFDSEAQAHKAQAVDARARMEAGAAERAMAEVELEARERKLQARAAMLEAQEAALRANTLKSEAARSQQEQALEAQAQMEARAEERANEVKARERQLQDLSADLETRKAAFQAEILKAEAPQARRDQALALGALAQTEAGVENRVQDEAKAREHSVEELAAILEAQEAALQAEISKAEASQLQKEEALQMEASAGELVMEEAKARERNLREDECMLTDSEAQEAAVGEADERAAALPGTNEMADGDDEDRAEAAESVTGSPSKRQRTAEGTNEEGDE